MKRAFLLSFLVAAIAMPALRADVETSEKTTTATRLSPRRSTQWQQSAAERTPI